MRMLSRCSKHPLDVPIDSPHHADARAHEQVAAFGGADQATDRCLPFLDILLSPRQACDVVAGIAQSHQLAPTRQQDRIIQGIGPDGSRLRSGDRLSAFRDVLRAQLAFVSAASIAALSEQIVVLS
jgi:hypothetical protein